MSKKGIVAKRKTSKYYFNKRTKNWIKIKNLLDDDFVVCGFTIKENNMINIILGQYMNSTLVYKGSVLIAKSSKDFHVIQSMPKISKQPFNFSSKKANVIWIKPTLVCIVEYMMLTKSGSMRQPVFRGLRTDKLAIECVSQIR